MAREVGTEKLVNALAESVKPRLSGSKMPLDAFQVLDVLKVSFVTRNFRASSTPPLFLGWTKKENLFTPHHPISSPPRRMVEAKKC